MDNDKSIEEYINFVINQINKYKKHVKFTSVGDLQPWLINKALAQYTDVNLALNSEYERIKWEYQNFKEKFQAWWDEKFVKTREELNPVSLASGKWKSVKEIEAQTRYKYASEYAEWRNKLKVLEHKVAFYRRLLENWKTHKDILVNLSFNLRGELKALQLENNNMNNPEGIEDDTPVRPKSI